MLDEIRDFYAYNTWANGRILDTAERLDQAQLVAADDGADSVRDTLAHTLFAQWLWLQRWLGDSPRGRWDAAEFPDVAALRRRWAEVERESDAYLARLDEATLAQPLSYVNSRGQTWVYPLWQQLMHQVNHATQHRSEVASRLTQLGHSPGDLDYLIYHDELGGTKVADGAAPG
jgi:uncharacterized damage-inducible protein DinB